MSTATATLKPAAKTPLPWKAEKARVYSLGDPVADCFIENDADYDGMVSNAEYIAHAANCFPQLVDALWAVQQLLTPEATHCQKVIADALAQALPKQGKAAR